MTILHSQQVLESAFKQACMEELEALKPGNVHLFADGHRMVVQDFIKSAEASAPFIANPTFAVGERVLQAMQATWGAVECNTNLGILLLCAPLLKAAASHSFPSLKLALANELRHLTVADARAVYRAIQVANPAGLGEREQFDVHAEPDVSLLHVMQYASRYDTIAKQYATDYAMVFDVLVPMHQQLTERWGRPAWATTGVFLYLLAHGPDTHIQRKFGEDMAIGIMHEMQPLYAQFIAAENPKTCMPMLLSVDSSLKARGINPGTSADMIVACLLVNQLLKI